MPTNKKSFLDWVDKFQQFFNIVFDTVIESLNIFKIPL